MPALMVVERLVSVLASLEALAFSVMMMVTMSPLRRAL